MNSVKTAMLLGLLTGLLLVVGRSREYSADASGAKLLGDPRPLASALEKLGAASGRISLEGATPTNAHLCIVNPLAGGGLMALFSTHPPLEERIRRLLAMSGAPQR